MCLITALPPHRLTFILGRKAVGFFRGFSFFFSIPPSLAHVASGGYYESRGCVDHPSSHRELLLDSSAM
ncbi:unnamed protein product [Nippostrongylus brasiliensis]|uniref:Secreted protein n=1 Tax=Nippostrongylus brasiliensis TaxID=27835 RepID=A0A0N4YYZ9_NIPBR|nr:unnamed protein product [Nippostrongylus brasiliensis]